MQQSPVTSLPGSWIGHSPEMRLYQGLVWYQRDFVAKAPGAGNRVRVACKDDGNRRLIAEVTLGLKGNIPGGSMLSDLLLAADPIDPGCPAGVVDSVGPQ